MVFAILLGATAFSMAFSYTGGDYIVEELLSDMPGGAMGFLILSMVAIMILGFFIDFVEISFIIVFKAKKEFLNLLSSNSADALVRYKSLFYF